MKKPLNTFTRFVWGLLAAYVLINIALFVTSRFYLDLLPQGFGLQLVQTTIYAIVVFGGVAVTVELLDQIRWNALSPEQRVNAKRS